MSNPRHLKDDPQRFQDNSGQVTSPSRNQQPIVPASGLPTSDYDGRLLTSEQSTSYVAIQHDLDSELTLTRNMADPEMEAIEALDEPLPSANHIPQLSGSMQLLQEPHPAIHQDSIPNNMPNRRRSLFVD